MSTSIMRREVMAMHDDGASIMDIARLVGIPKGQVARIIEEVTAKRATTPKACKARKTPAPFEPLHPALELAMSRPWRAA